MKKFLTAEGAEDRRQKTEDGGQTTEDGRQKTKGISNIEQGISNVEGGDLLVFSVGFGGVFDTDGHGLGNMDRHGLVG